MSNPKPCMCTCDDTEPLTYELTSESWDETHHTPPLKVYAAKWTTSRSFKTDRRSELIGTTLPGTTEEIVGVETFLPMCQRPGMQIGLAVKL